MKHPRVVVPDGDDDRSERVGSGQLAGPARAWAGLFLVLVARGYRAFLLTLVAIAIVPTLWSWTSYVVESGSMSPALSVGDVVVAKPLAADERVPKAVMVFTDPAWDRVLIHRVIERLGDGTFITAGDANESADSTPVPRKNFIAQGTLCIPFVGLPIVWLQRHDVLPLLLWALFTMGAFYVAGRRQGPPRHRLPSQEGDGSERMQGKSGVLIRGVAAVAVAALLALGLSLAPFERANAAFSDQTSAAGNIWKVAPMAASKATSMIQVYDTPSSSGWYQRGSVAVNIYATAAPGSSVRSITYRINGGSAITINSSSIVFFLSTQGDNTITYFATDNKGAAESPHTAHIKLDNQSPTLTVTSRVGDMTHAQWRANCARPGSTGGVCGAVSDGSGSGIASVTYVLARSSDQRCFDGGKWTAAACSGRTVATVASGFWVALVPDALLQVPRTWYTITIYVTDVAGNGYNTTRSFSVG